MCETDATGVKHCKILNIELFWHVRTSTLRGRPETSTILYRAWPSPAAARVQAGPGVPPGGAPGRRRRPRYGFKMGGGPPLGTRTPDGECEDDAPADAADIPYLPEAQGDEYVQHLPQSEAELLQLDQREIDVQETGEEEVESEDEDLGAMASPSGPRTTLKVNSSLQEALSGVPNIRTTNFNSKRQLTLD